MNVFHTQNNEVGLLKTILVHPSSFELILSSIKQSKVCFQQSILHFNPDFCKAALDTNYNIFGIIF